MELLVPDIFQSIQKLRAAQSTRHGGVSRAPYASLNLGKSTDDKAEHVEENRRRFCTALGFESQYTALSRQVHGDAIHVAEAPGLYEGFDALITDKPGILLGVSIADCTPILIYDDRHRAIAAVHAGWKGTLAGIVGKSLTLMAEKYGTRGADCFVFIGACIDRESFEVGGEVSDLFNDDFKIFLPDRGKYAVDLKKANAAQCYTFGIPEEQVEISPLSTVLNNGDFFSHRAEKGLTGRMLAAIGLKE